MSAATVPHAGPLDAARPPRPSFGREFATVFGWELRQLALSARTLWSVAVFAGFAALAVSTMVWSKERAYEAFREQTGGGDVNLDQFAEEALATVLKALGWGDAGLAAEIFRDEVPLLFVAFFGVASWVLPLLVALVSFDQFSELSTRGARFALLRSRREAWFAGKAVAGAASLALFLALAWACVLVAALAQGSPPGVAVVEAVRAWALMTLLALPYLGLTAIVSSLTRPGVAFVAVFAVWIGIAIAEAWVARRGPEVLLAVFPSTHAPGLIQRYGPAVLTSVGGLLAITIVTFAVALLVVRRRDV